MKKKTEPPRFCVLALIGCVLWTVCAFSADLSSQERQKADEALQNFDATIMRIKSGVCRIVGKTTEPNGNVIDDDIFIAFDYDAKLYRFDNGDLKRALLTPEFFYEVWNLNTNGVSVKKSPASAPEATSVHCRLVDVQNLFRFVPVGPHRPNAYRESAFHLQNKEVTKVAYEELPDGFVKVTTSTPPDAPVAERTEYLLDQKNGWTPTQIKRDCGYTFDLSWKKIDETWVPVSYRFQSGPKFGDFGVEWKIDWEQVGGKVDDAFFDLDEALADQENGAIIFDASTIVGKIGGGTPLPETARSAKPSYFRYVLIAAGAILILLVLGKKICGRKTR